MPERRPLTEGLKSPPPAADPAKEQDFVYGRKRPDTTTPEPRRVALSTRIRGDFVQPSRSPIPRTIVSMSTANVRHAD